MSFQSGLNIHDIYTTSTTLVDIRHQDLPYTLGFATARNAPLRSLALPRIVVIANLFTKVLIDLPHGIRGRLKILLFFLRCRTIEIFLLLVSVSVSHDNVQAVFSALKKIWTRGACSQFAEDFCRLDCVVLVVVSASSHRRKRWCFTKLLGFWMALWLAFAKFWPFSYLAGP